MSRTLIFLLVVLFLASFAPAAMSTQSYIVAYESTIADDSWNIYTTDLNGSEPVLAREAARHPALTTSGTLFFTEFEETVWGDYSKTYYLTPQGKMEITINTIFTELEPCPARDGKSVVYVSLRADTKELFFAPLNGTDPDVRLTQNGTDDIEPSMDSKGENIYYTVVADDESYIYKIDTKTLGQQRLTKTGAKDRHPSVDANNKLLAFASERDGNSEIYLMDLATGGLTRLTNDAAWDGNPCISSDGAYIVFSSDRDGNKEIYSMKTDGSGLTRLTTNETEDDLPSIN